MRRKWGVLSLFFLSCAGWAEVPESLRHIPDPNQPFLEGHSQVMEAQVLSSGPASLFGDDLDQLLRPRRVIASDRMAEDEGLSGGHSSP